MNFNEHVVVLKRTDLTNMYKISLLDEGERSIDRPTTLLGAGVLGYGFGTFTDGVLGQFTGQEKAHRSLNFPARYRRPLVVVGETRSFGSDSFKNIINKTVHDTHGLTGNSGIGMYLFKHFVNVNRVTFLPPALLLFVSLGDVLLGLSGLLGGFTTSLGRHDTTAVT